MIVHEIPEERLRLNEARLCLDFANTVDWHASSHPSDNLPTYERLVEWAYGVALLDQDQVQHLLALAETDPEASARALADAVALREAIYRLFSAWNGRRPFNQSDLGIVNHWLGQAAAHSELVRSEEGFVRAWLTNGGQFTWLLWPIAASAGRLLLSPEREQVKECEDDRGCGYLFLDVSRNRSRRWCSMESCGNRAKVRRHRQKQQGQDATT